MEWDINLSKTPERQGPRECTTFLFFLLLLIPKKMQAFYTARKIYVSRHSIKEKKKKMIYIYILSLYSQVTVLHHHNINTMPLHVTSVKLKSRL